MRLLLRTSFRLLDLAISCTLFLRLTCAIPLNPNQKHSSYNYGVDRNTILKRQSPNFYAINGIQSGSGPNGSLPLRLEIRELEQEPTMWTLYILGLDMLQYTNQTEMLSWYQIAGIHGRPFVPFDNVPAEPGDENNGYCTHVLILFLTWHRPYLALYEQVLYNIIQQIAQKYPTRPERDKYIAAAANFRIPYWDWAAVAPSGQSVYPQSIGGSPSVSVNGPAGNQTIANPLYSYQFKPLNPNELPDAPFNQYPQTLRYPTTQDASAVSQNDLVAQQLDSNASSLRQRPYMLFTYYHDYNTFRNEAWIDSNNNPNGYDSIESVHDQIHGLTGNGGHMTYIDYSAFDPLFWLHHAMVDRCFAMWQILNPNSYVAPELARYSTFTNSAGQTQDVNSLLTPFHKDVTGDFWTSEDVRSTETFGYSYPETTNYAGGNSTSQVIEAINRLYGPIASASSQLDSRRFPSRISGNASSVPRSWEWTANIRVQKCALAVPFYIHIFIGPFSPDPFSWSFDPNLVGTHFVFVKAFSTFSAPCHCNSDQMVGATIPLTDSLVKNINQGNLKTLDPDDINPFLAKHLSYRLSYLNDMEISKGSVPSLKISVVSVAVTKPRSHDELPRWGDLRGHMDVSTG